MEEWLLRLIGYSLHVAVGLLASIFIYFILRRSVLGKFWAALIIGIIGSVIGAFLLDDIFKKLTDVYNINLLAAAFFSCLLIWFYSMVAPGSKK